MGDFPRRIGQRQRNRPLVHRCRQPRDPRRPGLVAQQPVDPLRHETLLPAPHGDLALARLAHDRVRPDAVCRHQHDARSPHMLLSAVPIRDDRLQTRTIGAIHLDCDPLAHARPPSPTQPSIHQCGLLGKVELKNYKGEDEEGVFTHLPLKEELRCLIASLYSRRSSTAKSGARVFGAPDDKDIARRCAFYAGTDLSEKDIGAGFSRDKDVFLFAVLKNTYVLLHEKKRALIEKQLSGSFIREYRRRCEDIHKSNKYFDITPVSDSGRDLLDEFQQQSSKEMSLLEKISAQNEQLSARLKGYERRVYWIVVIIIVAVYLM